MGKDQQREKAGVHDFCSNTYLNSGKKENLKKRIKNMFLQLINESFRH